MSLVPLRLQVPFVVEAVILPVRYDDVVSQAYVHCLCGFLDEFGQVAVVAAGTRGAGGVVVDEDDLHGTLQQGLAQDGADIGGGLVNAAAADAYFVDDFGCLVEEEYPKLFGGEVAQQGVEQVVDVYGGTDGGAFGAFLQFAPLAQFQCRHDGDAFGGAESLEAGEITYFPFAELVQVVAAGGKHPLHQGDGAFFRVARTDEDGKQFGIAQGFRPFLHHFLPRAVFYSPLIDIQFIH